ncbi:MAG: hypothetical protein M3245_01765 [Actinomycetota bacterium]|nr:hypothetical protein [Actinomycetota bacterium]
MTTPSPTRRCRRCHEERPPDLFHDDDDVCVRCRRWAVQSAVANAMAMLEDDVVAVPGGYRMSVFAGDRPVDWLCDHVHPTPEEAFECVKGEGGCTCAFHLSTEQVRRCIARRSRR